MTTSVPATQGKKTVYVGGLAEEVDEKVSLFLLNLKKTFQTLIHILSNRKVFFKLTRFDKNFFIGC